VFLGIHYFNEVSGGSSIQQFVIAIKQIFFSMAGHLRLLFDSRFFKKRRAFTFNEYVSIFILKFMMSCV
jgi:hypothetical protein